MTIPGDDVWRVSPQEQLGKFNKRTVSVTQPAQVY
jgi:hypothetical protein